MNHVRRKKADHKLLRRSNQDIEEASYLVFIKKYEECILHVHYIIDMYTVTQPIEF